MKPGELSCAGTFGSKRLSEFAAGRACARVALEALGVEHCELTVRPDRQPSWPNGTVGSISHSGPWCGAVAVGDGDLRSVGLDVEGVGRVTPDLWERLFVANELSLLHGLPSADAARVATVLFSAKEAVYKCRFALTGGWLDFTDVEITFARDATSPQGNFSAKLIAPDDFTHLNILTGRYVVIDDIVWSGVAVASAKFV